MAKAFGSKGDSCPSFSFIGRSLSLWLIWNLRTRTYLPGNCQVFLVHIECSNQRNNQGNVRTICSYSRVHPNMKPSRIFTRCAHVRTLISRHQRLTSGTNPCKCLQKLMFRRVYISIHIFTVSNPKETTRDHIIRV